MILNHINILPVENFKDLIFRQIEGFKTISLDEIAETKLMNRYDSKYWLNYQQLSGILSEIQNDYFVLAPGGNKLQKYNTVYFDTTPDFFYISHQNGKAGRIKIRKRKYVYSGISFLEIKLKSNKGKSGKKRMSIESISDTFSLDEKEFISTETGINTDELIPKLQNSFYRITLVGKKFDERCTIDMNITFNSNGFQIDLDKFVIIELKKNALHNKSVLAGFLKNQKINPEGFSKYCIARALTNKNLKQNNFKPKILALEKRFNPIITKNENTNH